ncbi:peptide chain release factor N(5)-glutamine methyltransferase [Aurantiacibacter sp. MUD11]|uniref:peptide chain release factor N(5)-glutamine methyltransferase n=1 Tax=Aurantiacibacter sp. MUD11 TaxID=3003265 RepID=UPI0022AB1674|nr:peptide chain release factor N(5)-glutamine methyltransferase [Aurantiacibacter sp. MUD11]WAT17365.1 peptide chain release factor N(5)-glutamine methyltransferase [Aurantiacibacter sp. MUD11]
MTVSDAIREAATRLMSTSDTARLDAELLMAHALGVSRSELLLRHMQEPEPDGFAPLVERRLAREPVAYLLGEQQFYGLDFTVSPAVLIPRADSETVVQAALDAAPDARRVLDLGTGSGALLLTVLAHLPEAEGVGIDASPAALEVAMTNADRLGLLERARLLERSWLVEGWADDLGRFDLLLANPPYVEDDAALDPDVRDFEPASALFAGPEGLDDYRAIIPQLLQLLTESGVAVLEIGALQAGSVAEIAEEHGFAACAHKDLGGRDRALVLRLRLGKGDSSS